MKLKYSLVCAALTGSLFAAQLQGADDFSYVVISSRLPRSGRHGTATTAEIAGR